MILNLGCGKDYRKDCINIDINPRAVVDRYIDICDPMAVTFLGANSFDKIIAHNVLEHVSDLMKCMNNCLALLKEGGIMEIIVPHDLGWGSWEDPTHLRCFNERSFHYYWDNADYLGWDKHGLKTISLNVKLFPGIGGGLPMSEIIKIPRATTQIEVTLKKEKLHA